MSRFLLVLLAACGAPASLSTQAPPPPGESALSVTQLMPGQSAQLTAVGVPPLTDIVFFRGVAPGQDTCFPNLADACLDVVEPKRLGRATSDENGVVTFSEPIAGRVPVGLTGFFQAAWLDGGLLGKTPVRARTTGAVDADLLITEFAAQPTDGEFIEVHNPSDDVVDLSNVWLADHNTSYEVTVGDGSPSASDFRVRFPDGAVIFPGGYVTVALDPAADFFATYGVMPDYDLDADDLGAPAMVGEYGGSSGLTNGDEMIHLFFWDGASDAVVDLDYVVYGNTSDAMDRSGVTVGAHTYLAETGVADQMVVDTHADGESVARCDLGETGQVDSGGNGLGGSDETSEDFSLTFDVRELPTPGEGIDCSEVTLDVEPIEDFMPPMGFEPVVDTVFFTSEGEFESYFGATAPASVDFGDAVLLYIHAGSLPFPGSYIELDSVVDVQGDLQVMATGWVPAAECSVLEYAPDVWYLWSIARPAAGLTSTSANILWSDNPCVGGATIGNTCSVSSLCEPGLVCHALTVWEEGFCRDDGDNGRFFGFGGAVPDNDPTGLVVTVEASGLASVPEDAILSLELSHPDPSQLMITLANPLGTPTVVWDHGDGAGSELMLTLPVFAPGDEDANGTWTLTVVDDVAGDSGDLEAWDLELTSRFD